MAKRVQFDIVGNDKTATGINSAIGNLNRLDADVKKITKTFDVLKGSIIVGFATQAVKAIGQFAASCITDFSKVEKAQLRLELAMKSTGGTLSSINGFINELALKSSASATDLTILASEIAALGKTQPEIEKLMTAANALAEATGTNVTEAFKKLQSTYTGSVDELGKLIPELRTLSKEQLANGDAVDIVTAKFKDFVDVTGASTAQSIKNYSDAISTLKETLGQGWAEAFQPLVNAATEAVNKVIEQLNRASAAKRRASGQADIVTTVSKGDSAGLSKAAEGMSSAELRDAYRLAVQANPLATAKQQAALDQLLVLANERVTEERKAAQAAEKASTITSTTTTAVIPTTATISSKPDAFEEFVKAIRNEMGMASGRPVETGIEEYGDAMWSTGNGSRGGYSAFGGQDMSLIGLLEPFLSTFTAMIQPIMMIKSLLDPIGLVLQGFFDVLGPAITQTIQPLFDALKNVGGLLAEALFPILNSLAPIFSILADILMVALMPVLQLLMPGIEMIAGILDVILTPVLKAVAVAFEILMAPIKFVGDLFQWVATAIKNAVHNLVEYMDHPFDANKRNIVSTGAFSSDAFSGLGQRIADIWTKDYKGTLAPAPATSSGGGSSSYTAAKDVTINISFTNSYVNGDAREIALALRNEIRQAEALGY